MTTSDFETFLRGIGHKVVYASGIPWFNVHRRVYSPLPFQLEINPATTDWPAVFANGVSVVRCAAGENWGRESYRLLVDSPNYDLDSLSAKTRNQTRRGLEACAVRQLDPMELAEQGLDLQRETLARQGRAIPRGFRSYWLNYFACASSTPTAMCWGAFHESRLAAFLIAFRMDYVAHILIVRSSTASLRYYPNNALLFSFVKHALSNNLCREVSIGFESLQPDLNSLDKFKEGLGFARRPTRQFIKLSPLLDRIMRGSTLEATMFALSLLRQTENVAKFEGMLAWYRDQSKGRGA